MSVLFVEIVLEEQGKLQSYTNTKPRTLHILVAQWIFVDLIRLRCPDCWLKTESIVSENGGVTQILGLLSWAQQVVSQESSALRWEKGGTT